MRGGYGDEQRPQPRDRDHVAQTHSADGTVTHSVPKRSRHHPGSVEAWQQNPRQRGFCVPSPHHRSKGPGKLGPPGPGNPDMGPTTAETRRGLLMSLWRGVYGPGSSLGWVLRVDPGQGSGFLGGQAPPARHLGPGPGPGPVVVHCDGAGQGHGGVLGGRLGVVVLGCRGAGWRVPVVGPVRSRPLWWWGAAPTHSRQTYQVLVRSGFLGPSYRYVLWAALITSPVRVTRHFSDSVWGVIWVTCWNRWCVWVVACLGACSMRPSAWDGRRMCWNPLGHKDLQ